MAWARAALALIAAAAIGLVLVSGSSSVDPRTPAALPGEPPPFLGTAIAGGGKLTAAVDAYGDVVDLLAPGPAGESLIDNPSDRQTAGSVEAATGIRPRVRIGGGPWLAMWEADVVRQRYLPGTNVVRTAAKFGAVRVVTTVAALGSWLAVRIVVRGTAGSAPSIGANLGDELRCRRERRPGQADLLCGVDRPLRGAVAGRGEGTGQSDSSSVGAVIRAAARADRGWLARAQALGAGAPRWGSEMYERSLLAMRALTDRGGGAVAAGARDGWAYVWPRDAAAVALALAAAGYRGEARRVARFLAGLDLAAAARFDGGGEPVGGRAAQGDAAGWAAAAAEAAGLSLPTQRLPWRDRGDYHEGAPGDYLADAIAAGDLAAIRAGFETERGLVRRENDPGSGLDSAAAWAVRPFALRSLHPAAERTMQQLTEQRGRYGITPGESWRGGVDPWSAPTAWSAWGLAALSREAGTDGRGRADRRAALALLGALRRSATAAGALPERVDRRTGVPRSTTPLAWSHAFAALAVLELWPPDLSSSHGGAAGEAR
ncbi:MAG: glycoside hydrolase family 15 protein [Solirubrobacterales bacterium]